MTLLRSIYLVPVCLLCLATSQVSSQIAPILSALAGCWSAKISKETALAWTTELLGEKQKGECPVTATEDWFVCLIQDSDGNLNGEMTKNRNERSNGTGGLLCSSFLTTSMHSPVYRCRIAQKAGAAELVAKRTD